MVQLRLTTLAVAMLMAAALTAAEVCNLDG